MHHLILGKASYLWALGASLIVIARYTSVSVADLRDLISRNPQDFAVPALDFPPTDANLAAPGTCGVPAYFMRPGLCEYSIERNGDLSSPRALCCGEPTADGLSYCPYHARLMAERLQEAGAAV
ncbi:hypothetical protein Rvan_1473 [Rhodomicrobium vannielii ATCC 17100]|uniref:GcrA cell cycle regulator n=1 Tax=Rhodomicrobium vannielii (strain ATCC 17100 / DSM 162 / LMG 4299 / NCIMB 10020 / ATH 3.1.1) TaxID=648757 RepID=E3I777_RHOVT|nr:hypothetical protein Rvan_1473 [Rhodomicrobium vannielii ATCC 17100]